KRAGHGKLIRPQWSRLLWAATDVEGLPTWLDSWGLPGLRHCLASGGEAAHATGLSAHRLHPQRELSRSAHGPSRAGGRALAECRPRALLAQPLPGTQADL